MTEEFKEFEFIWLQPSCKDCESLERTWCQDNVYEPCEECGKKSVKYKLVKVEDDD